MLRVEHAESDYLETLAETGLAGLAFAVAGLAGLLAGPRRADGRATGPVVRGVSRGAAAARVDSSCAPNAALTAVDQRAEPSAG